MYTINIWPVLVATIVSFVIGAFWYSPVLFGKEWISLIKISDEELEEAKRGMWKSYIIQFVITLISFCVIAFAIAVSGTKSPTDGAVIGLIAWLGFILPKGVAEVLWQRTPLKLFFIDTVNYLVTMIVGGAIIVGWR